MESDNFSPLSLWEGGESKRGDGKNKKKTSPSLVLPLQMRGRKDFLKNHYNNITLDYTRSISQTLLK